MSVISSFSNWLATAPVEPFRRSLIGWVLVALNLAMTGISMNFFLGMMKSGVAGWLMMNTCAPSIFLFVLGFLLGSPAVMAAGAIAMFRYGTLGMFVFSWTGSNLIAQVGHIFMTAGVVYTLVEVVRGHYWPEAVKGLGLALALLIPFTIVQENWVRAHPELIEKLFAGTMTLPD